MAFVKGSSFERKRFRYFKNAFTIRKENRLTCIGWIVPLEWRTAGISCVFSENFRIRVERSRIFSFLPADILIVYHADFIAVVRHSGSWQRQQQHIHRIDSLNSISSAHTRLIVIAQLSNGNVVNPMRFKGVICDWCLRPSLVFSPMACTTTIYWLWIGDHGHQKSYPNRWWRENWMAYVIPVGLHLHFHYRQCHSTPSSMWYLPRPQSS